MEQTQWKSIIKIKSVLPLSISLIAKTRKKLDTRKQVSSGRTCEWRWNRECLRCSVPLFIDWFRVYYRRTVPAEQPLNSGSPRDRSPPHRRHRRSSTRSPSPPPPPPPPPVSSRGRYSSSSRHQRAVSPPRSPPPMRSSRAPRRPYSPYIPLPPDLVDYVSAAPSRHRQHSSPSPVRRHHHKHSSKSHRSRSPNSHRSASASPVHRAHAEPDGNGQSEPTRTLLVENLDRDVSESKLKETFGRYGTIHESKLAWLQHVFERRNCIPRAFVCSS